MFHIVLFQPEIPPNTGNIIRLCANTGSQLHLIEPLGFSMDDKLLRRAGLDYHEFASVKRYPDWQHFLDYYTNEVGGNPERVFGLTTKGSRNYTEVQFQPQDVLLFGPETRGLPAEIRESLGPAQCLRLPMLPDSRSLNLSNTAAIMVYHAWHQLGFTGGK